MDARRVSRVSAILLAAAILLAGQLAQGQNVYVEPFITLIKSSHVVPPGRYQPFELSLEGGSALVVEAYTQAGIEAQFEVRLTDPLNFEKLKSGQGFNALLGKSTILARTSAHVIPRHEFLISQPGRYFLVLDNRAGSLFSQKISVLAYAVLPHPTEASRGLESFLQRFYSDLKNKYSFDDFQIEMRRCGEVNARSNPNIRLCLELAQDMIGLKFPGALSFALLHEVGHSLLNLWGDSTWADEDQADQIATAFMVMRGLKDQTFEAIQWLRRQDSLSLAISKLLEHDPHSIPVRRAKNIEGWMSQADRVAGKWHVRFLPHTKTEALKALEENPRPWVDREQIRAELSRR